MKLLSPLLLCLLVVPTTASQLRSLPAEEILNLLRISNVKNEFLSVFEDQGYDGFALDVLTKEDLDAEFPNSSPIHRRTLYSKIQDLKNHHRVARNLKEDAKYEAKPASYFKDYHGVNLNHEKGWITFGKDKDIKIYRDGKGMLKFEAAAIDFVSAKFTHNGKALGFAGPPPAGQEYTGPKLNIKPVFAAEHAGRKLQFFHLEKEAKLDTARHSCASVNMKHAKPRSDADAAFILKKFHDNTRSYGAPWIISPYPTANPKKWAGFNSGADGGDHPSGKGYVPDASLKGKLAALRKQASSFCNPTNHKDKVYCWDTSNKAGFVVCEP